MLVLVLLVLLLLLVLHLLLLPLHIWRSARRACHTHRARGLRVAVSL